jgi:hypothetical protein
MGEKDNIIITKKDTQKDNEIIIEKETLKDPRQKSVSSLPEQDPASNPVKVNKNVINDTTSVTTKPQKVVPAEKIVTLPEGGRVLKMSPEQVKQYREIYRDELVYKHLDSLVKILGLDPQKAPGNRDELFMLRRNFMELRDVKGSDGKLIILPGGKIKQDYFFKDDVSDELKNEFIWLMEYYKINDHTFAEFSFEKKVTLPINNYDASVKGLEKTYEHQDSQNCYCCVGSTMLNQFLRAKNDDKEPKRVYNQYDMRAFRPSIKKYRDEFEQYADRGDYDKHIRELSDYAGAGKNKVGNVFEMGDFFIEHLSQNNAMLNKMVFSVPGFITNDTRESDRIANNMKAVFMDKVAEVLRSGNVVGFLTTWGEEGHYVTITGIKGEEIEYLDSASAKDYNKVHHKSVDAFLERPKFGSNQVEIEWISQMKSPAEMKKEFSQLQYNEDTGYSLSALSDENVLNVGQTKGLAVKKQLADYEPGKEYVTHVVYIPNPKAQVETETIEEHKWQKVSVKAPEHKNKQFYEIKDPEEEIIITTTKEPKTAPVIVETEEPKEESAGFETDETKEESVGFEAEKPKEESKEEPFSLALKDFEQDASIDMDEPESVDERKQLRDAVHQYKEELTRTEKEEREKNKEIAEVNLEDSKEKYADIKDDKERAKKIRNYEEREIKRYEKRRGDYDSFGITFDLENLDINAADSKYMKNVKGALLNYLTIRKQVFKRHGFAEMTAMDILAKDNQFDKNRNKKNFESGDIETDERRAMGEAYEYLHFVITKYTRERETLFMTKRRRKRLSQIYRIKDQLRMDNIRFRLSDTKRAFLKSVDSKYDFKKIRGFGDLRKAIVPTWEHFAYLSDTIFLRNMAHKDLRDMQKRDDALPGMGERIATSLGNSALHGLMRMGMAYEAAGGTVDRTLGVATMLAANTLELAGKAVKLPLKILSGIFNLGSKYIAGSKVRWRMDYSLKTGWKSIEDGRRIFRRYLKGACVLPVFVIESLTRGLPYLFSGHKFKSGVYKRTSKWSKAILNDVANVLRSVAMSEKYATSKRAEEDYEIAGGYTGLNEEKPRFVSGKVLDEQEIEPVMAEVRAEVDSINKRLKRYAAGKTDLKSKEMLALHMKKTAALMKILLGDDSRKDSPLMVKVKTDIIKLTGTLESMKTAPVSREAVTEFSSMYAIAINSCSDYLEKRKSGTKRWDAVYQVWQGLMYENSVLNLMKEEMGKVKKGTSMGQFMQYSVEGAIPGKYSSLLATAEEPFSKNAAYVRNVFCGQYDFSATFSGNSVSAGTKKKEAGKVMQLRNLLREFKPGVTTVRNVNILGREICLFQKADNTLYIIDNHELIPLEKTAELVVTQIERNMMDHPAAYGADNIGILLNEYSDVERLITSGEYSRMRVNLENFLMDKLKLERTAFNNLRRVELARFAGILVRKPENADKVKAEVAKLSGSRNLINGAELTELLEIDARKSKEIEERVSIYKTKIEADENDFSKEEKEVQNLMADFIFANDTLIMDMNADNPEKFVRTVFTQNIPALATLIMENRSADEDILSDMFKKMSLDQIFGEKDTGFCQVISTALRSFCDYFRKTYGTDNSREEVEKKLGEVLKNSGDKKFNAFLKSIHESVDQSVKDACEILQSDVSKIADNIFAKSSLYSENTLEGIMKNATRSEEGQGKFTRTVFNRYFKEMPVLDQRCMIASVIRGARKVDVKELSDQELIDEINSRKLRGYPFFKNRDLSKKKLSKHDQEILDRYRSERRRTQIGANYLAGLIRGAGPLFQKMMQSLPLESLPKEIALALEDVKSKLPPIPERVVKTQINAMIERSGDTIKRIDVIKNLGAASVGQTFLCRMYGPNLPAEGKQVVIKLLRPDVHNRMEREKEVMLSCARDTDEGMEATYRGQLSNYLKELDLKIEEQNIKDGVIYDNKYPDVESERVNNLIEPTNNSLVLELAEGRNLDDILKDACQVRTRTIEELRECRVDPNGAVHFSNIIKLNHESYVKTKDARNRLIDLANDLIKKRDIMADMTRVWLTEAIFGGGYYHADLHAGNIVISDKMGTLIDYGNASKFTGKQQAAISKMMTAAADAESPDVDVFFNSFNELLDMSDPKFVKFYDEKKQKEVKDAFSKVLKMGEAEQAGERISASLIKAQQLGVKLPPAIYNFSQGQLRLQQSINDINEEITRIKDEIAFIDNMTGAQNPVDIVYTVMDSIHDMASEGIDVSDKGAIFKAKVETFEPVDKKSFVSALLDNTYKKGKISQGIEEIDKRKEFDKKYLVDIKDVKDRLLVRERRKKPYMPDYASYRKVWENYKKQWADKKGSAGQRDAADECLEKMSPPNVIDSVYSLFGGQSYLMVTLSDAIKRFDDAKVNEILQVYEIHIPRMIEIDNKIKNLRKLQDEGKLTSATEKTLTDEIYKLYCEHHDVMRTRNSATMTFAISLDNMAGMQGNLTRLEGYFAVKNLIDVPENGTVTKKSIGKVFEEKLMSFMEFAEPYLDENGIKDTTPNDVLEEMEERKKVLADLHARISEILIKEYYEGRFERKISIKSYDFSDVMKDVIRKNWFKFANHVGVMNILKKAAETGADVKAFLNGDD